MAQQHRERYRLVDSSHALLEAVATLSSCKVVGIDSETTGLDPLADKIRLLQLAGEGLDRAFVIDVSRLNECDLAVVKTFLEGDQVKVLHNAKFDLKFLRQMGVRVAPPIFDTMLASQLLTAGYQVAGHSLGDLVRQYLGENLDKGLQISDWSGELTDDQLEYLPGMRWSCRGYAAPWHRFS